MRRTSPSTRNTSPLMVLMPCSVSSSHFKRLGCPRFVSAHGPGLILACAAFDRLRPSTTLNEMMPMILGMDTMAASLVNVNCVLAFSLEVVKRCHDFYLFLYNENCTSSISDAWVGGQRIHHTQCRHTFLWNSRCRPIPILGSGADMLIHKAACSISSVWQPLEGSSCECFLSPRFMSL